MHWRQRADINGFDALDVGIVAEVLQRWFGPVLKVSAIARTWVTERPADADGRTVVENPDAISMVGTFTSGVTLTTLFSGAIRGGEPHLSVYGDRGTLTCNPHNSFIRLRGTDDETGYDVPTSQQGVWTVEEDFVEAIRRGRKGTPSFHDGARYMAVTHAVIEAARTDQRVRVPKV